jgi:hypothetical protein
VAAAGHARERLKTAPPPFSGVVFVITLVGQVIAGLVAGLGTMTLSGKLGISPERALAVAGTFALLAAAGSGFLAAAVKRKVGTWEVLCTGLIFCVATTLILGRQLLSPFGLYRPVLADLGYLASMFGQNPMGGWQAPFVISSPPSSAGRSVPADGQREADLALLLRGSSPAATCASQALGHPIMTGHHVAGVAMGSSP